jgi:hypothetical protein
VAYLGAADPGVAVTRCHMPWTQMRRTKNTETNTQSVAAHQNAHYVSIERPASKILLWQWFPPCAAMLCVTSIGRTWRREDASGPWRAACSQVPQHRAFHVHRVHPTTPSTVNAVTPDHQTSIFSSAILSPTASTSATLPRPSVTSARTASDDILSQPLESTYLPPSDHRCEGRRPPGGLLLS